MSLKRIVVKLLSFLEVRLSHRALVFPNHYSEGRKKKLFPCSNVCICVFISIALYVCVFLVLGFILKSPVLLFRHRMCVSVYVKEIEGSLSPQSAFLNETQDGQEGMSSVTSWRLGFYLQNRFENLLRKNTS